MPVLIAGIGGASLGTEILKALHHAGDYAVFGCDISALAYGHYDDRFLQTFVVSRQRYVDEVLALSARLDVVAVIPGGEGPTRLLGPAAEAFAAKGVHLAGNDPALVALCASKGALFEHLRALDVPIPWTRQARTEGEMAWDDAPFPCVIKPASGSGGSRFVFLASSREEARLYVQFLLQAGQTPLLQEYVPLDGGEFTIGVLSLRDRRLVGSIALRRLFHAKLSVAIEMEAGIISSGYSQGLIDVFPDLQGQAEAIAGKLGSAGPLNVQGRVRAGRLLPFEINPRFSASTYLRALAGFNEVDIYLRHLVLGEAPQVRGLRPGYYLRSLSEVFVERGHVKQ